MSKEWYSRTVLFVSDMKRSIDFYVKKFGFTENWRFEAEGGNASVAQVARPGIELILAAESPEKMGKGLMFISLDGDDAVAALHAELEGRGVEVKEGIWGYRVMVITEPRRQRVLLLLRRSSGQGNGKEILTPRLLITRPDSFTISVCLPEASGPRKWAQPTGRPLQLT
jgi:catechol 2,3-dioxygenase-like lactoylglutathione lyase family enzyme